MGDSGSPPSTSDAHEELGMDAAVVAASAHATIKTAAAFGSGQGACTGSPPSRKAKRAAERRAARRGFSMRATSSEGSASSPRRVTKTARTCRRRTAVAF
jgi:hypothetical protein